MPRNTKLEGNTMKLTTYAKIGAIIIASSTTAFAESHDGDEISESAAIVEAALAGGDAAAGEKVFKKCKACHMIGEGAKDRTGPDLTGVVGSPLGTSETFKYSDGLVALVEEGTVWDIENLNALLTKPKDFITKTRMTFAGLKSEEDRANLIAYLATFTIEEVAETEEAASN